MYVQTNFKLVEQCMSVIDVNQAALSVGSTDSAAQGACSVYPISPVAYVI